MEEDTIPIFKDKETERIFKEKWQHRSVVTGKVFLVEEINEKGLEIGEDLEYQGWTMLLDIKEPVYPKIVRSFYVAA